MKSQNDEQKTDLTLKDEFTEVEKAITDLVKQKLLPDKYIKIVNNIKRSIPGFQSSDSPVKENILITKVLFRIASSGKILYLSASCDDLLGFKPDEMIGKSIFDFIAKSEKSQYFFLIKKLLKEKTIFQFKTKLVHKEGREVLVDVKASIQKEKGERFVLGSVNEIPQKNEPKEKFNTNEVIFKTVWQNSQHGIRLTDSKGIIYLCNQSFARMVKKDVDELIGQPISSVYNSKMGEKVMNDYLMEMASGNIKVSLESSLNLWNEERVDVEITNTLIKDAGKHKYLLSIFRDITQKKKDDELIKRKDQLLQGIAEASKLLISSKEEKDEFHGALGILGEAAKVDRVSIYQHKVDDQTQEMYFSLIHEWASDDVEHQLESPYFQKISYSRFAGLQFYENFSKGNPLRFLIDRLPQFSRDEFMDKKIKSIMLVPIMIEDEYWGFIGFDDVKTNREWTDDEESILVIMASTLGAVIKRNLFKEDLLRKNIELKKSAKQAERLSQLKSEFLSLMSHEIRTPLNGVLGMIDLMLDTNLEHNQKEYANTIKLSGEQLLSVINNILDFSKIESGMLEIEKVQFNLRECIEDSFDLLTLKASEKDIELFYSIDSETPQIITGDVIRLRQVLTNLISNGIKFTDKGFVEVSVKSEKKENNLFDIKFCVKDTGIGIPAEKLDRLFKPFSQIDPVDSRSYGGSGLGLVVAKKLVEMMDGKMSVESEYEKGTSFYFNINSEIPEIGLPHTGIKNALFNEKEVLIYSRNDSLLTSIESQLKDWGIKSSGASDESKLFQVLNDNTKTSLIIFEISSLSEDLSNNLIVLKTKTEGLEIPIIFLTPFGKSIEELNIFDNNNVKVLPKPLKYSSLHFVLRDLFSKALSNEKKDLKEVKDSPKPDNNVRYIRENAISSLFDFNTDEDHKHYIALLEVYMRDLPELAEKIDEAIRTDDFKKLKFYSHKLGGSIKNLGVEKVVTMCYAFEEAAKNKFIDESIINLNFEFQKVMNKILSEISELRFRQSNVN